MRDFQPQVPKGKGKEPEGREAAVDVWDWEGGRVEEQMRFGAGHRRCAGTVDREGQVRPKLDRWMADRYMCRVLGGRGQECRMKVHDEQTQTKNTVDARTFTSR